MAYQPTWRERLEEARPYFGPALALAIVLGLGGWLAWWYRSPQTGRARVVASASATDPVARARDLAAASITLEREAIQAQETGQLALAAEKGREAWRRQREANELVPAEAKDLPREARLLAAIEQLDAEPLRAAVGVGRSLATAARTRESWAEALKALGEARAAQAELNARFPDSRHANRALLEELDAQIASTLGAKAEARARAGDAATALARPTEAAAAYAQASEALREIEERFPRVMPDVGLRLEELAVKRETALATDALASLGDFERQIDAALRARRFDVATAKIAEASALIEKTTRALPRGLSAVGETRRKIQFLAERRGQIETIGGDVERALVPLPGTQPLALFKTEITQDLFARVVDSNPSRNVGASLPVDSVTWTEVAEFCQRLGWLTARRVRLPTEAEFRAARLAAPEIGWHAENAGGRTHEAGTAGAEKSAFRDLAGNVAEWLQPANDASDRAPIAGGSYLDREEVLQRTPIVLEEKRLRARHVGFRVVVERGD